jgi:hypothetical protein
MYIMLNVTEHRKNWFELPEIFRYAEKQRLYIHVNTCIHPHNVTLYTLPSDQLNYVLAFLEEQRDVLLAESCLSNLVSYDFLLSLIRSELKTRKCDWRPLISNRNQACDGFLSAPIPGLRPFETPAKVAREAHRILKMIGGRTASYMLGQMSARVRATANSEAWTSVAEELTRSIARLPNVEAGESFQ